MAPHFCQTGSRPHICNCGAEFNGRRFSPGQRYQITQTNSLTYRPVNIAWPPSFLRASPDSKGKDRRDQFIYVYKSSATVLPLFPTCRRLFFSTPVVHQRSDYRSSVSCGGHCQGSSTRMSEHDVVHDRSSGSRRRNTSFDLSRDEYSIVQSLYCIYIRCLPV